MAMPRSPGAPAGGASASSPGSTTPTSCPPRTPPTSGRRHTAAGAQDRLPAALAHRQFRRPRPAPPVARRLGRDGAARPRAARRRGPRHPARHEVDARRPRLPARPGLGHRPRARMSGAAAAFSASAAAFSFSAGASPTRRASRARPAPPTASACSMSRPRCCRKSASRAWPAATSPQASPSTGYEIHIGRTTGPDCARPVLEIADPPQRARPDGATPRPTAWSAAPMCTASSPADAFRARLARGARRHGAGLELCAARSTATLDRLADHLEAHADLDAILDIARRGG